MPMRLLLPLTLLIASLALAGPASAAKKRSIHLSLGDSLAWGYAKAPDGTVIQAKRDFSRLLTLKARRDGRYSRKLRLRRLACPGETVRSYRFGGRCQYAGFRSQAAAARAFARTRRNRIAFITITLGAGDLARCVAGTEVDAACFERGTARLRRHLVPIFRGLRRAAGRHVPIVAATQYDPYLALYLEGEEHRDTALSTVKLIRRAGQAVRAAAGARGAGIRIAGLYTAFGTEALDRSTTVDGQTVPVAVAAICELTLMCRSEPVGPDIHPSPAGHRRIAATFAEALRPR